jgi:proteasome accessory factor B
MPTPKRGPRPRPTQKTVSTAGAKLQRWIDLLAALLARRFPITFEELRPAVPAYAASDGPSLMRMFERDKDELRAFGVAIETVAVGDAGETGYRLRPQDFYLPFLAVATSSRTATRSTLPPEGYRSLAYLTFEPDELQMVADAAARVRQLGDPQLAADVDAAMRKLAFDLPPEAVREPGDERVLAERVDETTFGVLSRALLDHKTVAFEYHAMSSDETTRREVEPYGLVFLSAHWYLVARDRGRGELRTFRVSRIRQITANTRRSQSPDYEIPSTFKLEDYARSRDAWGLGADREIDVLVDFHGAAAAGRAAARLGQPVRGALGRRRFQVRRVDTFARWLLSFAGEAVPIEPPEMVERFRALASETFAAYGGTQ